MLPLLREDLELYPWEADRDGHSQWVIHDPARNKFFNISRDVIQILLNLDKGEPEAVANAVKSEDGTEVSAADVQSVVSFLVSNELVYAITDELQTALIKREHQRKTSLTQWLLHKYLFFRMPLLRPDRFLESTKAFVAPFYKPQFFLLTLFVGLLGLGLTLRDWNSFESNLLNLWSLSGFVKIAVTLIFIKTIHEFAHAYTAKRYGVKVPIMGVAFLVMFPLPYTDTSESWKLFRHNQRLKIASAGVVSELVVAAWATLLWKLVPAGALQDGLFILATTTWISTLAVNLSPFLRFDGYFVLMDYLQIPNLHARSGALAKWRMREAFFGLNAPKPETFGASTDRKLIAFAYIVWIYRLIVFIGIALLVYHFFAKAIGIVLFFVEIYYFVLKPVLMELQAWYRMREQIRMNIKMLRAAVLLGAVLALFSWPFTERVVTQGLYIQQQQLELFARESGEIASLQVQVGDRVNSGDTLLSLVSTELESELQQARLSAARVAEQLQLDLLMDDEKRRVVGREALWLAETARVENLERRSDDLVLTAPESGFVAFVDESLSRGVWVGEGDFILRLTVNNEPRIVAYLDDQVAGLLDEGQTVKMVFENRPEESQLARVSMVASVPSNWLEEPELALQAGGSLMVEPTDNGLKLDKALYRVELVPQTSVDGSPREPVALIFDGRTESMAQSLWRSVASSLLREFDF